MGGDNLKATKLLIGLLALAFIVNAGCGSGHYKLKYPVGRDTKAAFGDGRYQIAKAMYDTILYDGERQHQIAGPIKCWDSSGDMVFVMDKKGKYTILNFATGEVKSYDRLNDAPPEFKASLSKLW